jgi:hypothetical protein
VLPGRYRENKARRRQTGSKSFYREGEGSADIKRCPT